MKTVEELAKTKEAQEKIKAIIAAITDIMEYLHINQFEITAKTGDSGISVELEVKR
jgi:hypothetical protein